MKYGKDYKHIAIMELSNDDRALIRKAYKVRKLKLGTYLMRQFCKDLLIEGSKRELEI